MNNQLQNQYSTGLSQRNIEQALIAAGKDLDHLAPADLALLEDFHTMGRYATGQLVDLAGITSEDQGARRRQRRRRHRPLRRRPLRLHRLPPWISPTNTAKRAVGSIDSSDSTTGYRFVRQTSPNFLLPTALSTSSSASTSR